MHASSRKDLLHLREVPEYLQFNPYIHQGYRPLQSIWQCFCSLLYLHNETINILTHLVPCIVIVLLSPWLLPQHELAIPLLPYLHITALITPWLGSVIYHMFMNHHHGVKIYTALLQLDMAGIWFTHCVGAFTTIFTTIYCLHRFIVRLVLCLFVPYCFYGLHQCLLADTVLKRRMCFVGMILLQLLALFVRPLLGSSNAHSFSHYITQDVLAVSGAVIGAVRVPERWLPGRFDNWLNSHHIMHVMVVIAIYHMHCAAQLDLLWLSRSLC